MTFALKTKISTPLIEETKRFYQLVFGMVVREEWEEPGDKGVILAFADGQGEALLEIYHADVTPDFSALSLQFKTRSLETFLAGLPPDVSARGPVPRPWGSTYLYLTDPSGIAIIVYEGDAY